MPTVFVPFGFAVKKKKILLVQYTTQRLRVLPLAGRVSKKCTLISAPNYVVLFSV